MFAFEIEYVEIGYFCVVLYTELQIQLTTNNVDNDRYIEYETIKNYNCVKFNSISIFS